MEPAAALDRVAYLLEAESAESYKVKAFRRAAATVEKTPKETLKSLAASSRLTELEGVGKTTASVVEESLAGRHPSYLSTLEKRRAGAPSGRAGTLKKKLKGDCHSHTDWSDGGSPISKMAEAAKELGHDYLVVTDHSPRLTVAHGLTTERLERQLEEIESLRRELAPFRLLKGIEVDILDDGSLDQDDELLSQLDLVVASVHSKLRMDKRAMTRRLVNAVSNPLVDVLGHATGRLVAGRRRPESDFDHDEVFAACAASATAVEVNSRPDRRDPRPEILAEALEAGCQFAIDTDAHAPGQLEWLGLGCEQAVEAGITADKVVNTFPAPELRRRLKRS